MLKMRKDVEDLRCDIRQIQNSSNLYIFNAIEDFGIEMPIQSMDDYLNFDSIFLIWTIKILQKNL